MYPPVVSTEIAPIRVSTPPKWFLALQEKTH